MVALVDSRQSCKGQPQGIASTFRRLKYEDNKHKFYR